ncbi:hypothetical protein M8J76_013136 [Diaphorina citri]|nr:hypothetical protein M8J75_010859 [Diaphorina citri]KAI5745651.1 hypothetical protein M8J76_013136 [Diaphorina citri]
MSGHVIRKKNYNHKYILRLHEARVSNPKYKVDKSHKKLHIEAEKYWNSPDYVNTSKTEPKKYWSYTVDELVHGISQEGMFKKFFLTDCMILDETDVKIANAVFICIGETGKGKSYTIFGLDEPYENRGLALRIISSLFQLKTQYPSFNFQFHITAIEYEVENKFYDLLETPKIVKYNKTEFRKELVESEEYARDLVFQIASTRGAEKSTETDVVHHTSTVVLHLSAEISCEHRPHINIANVYLVDMEAFDHVRTDNMQTLETLNRKYFKIENFSKSLVKVIGTSDSVDENVSKIKSLMCLMKAVHKFIVAHTFDDSSVFTEKDNLNYLNVSLRNKIYEMNGVMKLARDRRIKNRDQNVIRDTSEFMKRLILAYVNDKVEETFIINLNVAPDVQFIFQVCKSLYEPLKTELENEKMELARQLRLDYIRRIKAPGQLEEEGDVEKESEKKINCDDLERPSKLQNNNQVKLEPFKVVWDEYLKTNPSLKFTLEFYRKELNNFQLKLNMKQEALGSDKFTQSLKEHEYGDLLTEVRYLKTQLELTRKKIIQIHTDYYPKFDEFCKENNCIAIPGAIDDMADTSKSSILLTSDKTHNEEDDNGTTELKSVDLETFSNYLSKLIKKSDLSALCHQR